MKFNERFIAGRLRRRRLRAPLLEGWLCDELGQRPMEAVSIALKKLDEVLALPIPGERVLVKLSPAATAAALAGESVDLLVGWPETIVIVRSGGVVVQGEGDVVHFGPLALDSRHSVMRSGYEYLADTGSEVRVELTSTAGDDTRTTMLEPGGQLSVGPYSITHDHSFDPSDRPGGIRHHGYSFTVTRSPGVAPPPRPDDLTHPLDVTDAGTLVDLARSRQLLGADEAVAAEPRQLATLLGHYEGPRQQCEAAIRSTGPDPATLVRRGEVLVVESPCLRRGSHGEALLGRSTITLDPTGEISVSHTDLDTVPGRLRRS